MVKVCTLLSALLGLFVVTRTIIYSQAGTMIDLNIVVIPTSLEQGHHFKILRTIFLSLLYFHVLIYVHIRVILPSVQRANIFSLQ